MWLIILLHVSACVSGAAPIRLLTLFPRSFTWNHAVEVCHSINARLLTDDSEDVTEAVLRFESTVWQGVQLFDFWTGLHYIDSDQGFVWVGNCLPLGSYQPFAEIEHPHLKSCVAAEMFGLRSGRPYWETETCTSTAYLICHSEVPGPCQFDLYDRRTLSAGTYADTIITDITTLTDCKEACLGETWVVECWALTFTSLGPVGSCRLHHDVSRTALRDRTRLTDIDSQLFVKFCFEGSLCQPPANNKYTTRVVDDVPWIGCYGTASDAGTSPETFSTTSSPVRFIGTTELLNSEQTTLHVRGRTDGQTNTATDLISHNVTGTPESGGRTTSEPTAEGFRSTPTTSISNAGGQSYINNTSTRDESSVDLTTLSTSLGISEEGTTDSRAPNYTHTSKGITLNSLNLSTTAVKCNTLLEPNCGLRNTSFQPMETNSVSMDTKPTGKYMSPTSIPIIATATPMLGMASTPTTIKATADLQVTMSLSALMITTRQANSSSVCWEFAPKEPRRRFSCRCYVRHPSDSFMVDIMTSLVLDLREVSAQKRRYKCLADDRTSAKTMGFLGISLLVCLFAAIFLSDIRYIHRDVYYLHRLCQPSMDNLPTNQSDHV